MLLWSGPSAYNSLPIVVVATFGSDNRKTGPMVQSWVLARDVSPVEVIQSRLLEAGICGACRHAVTVRKQGDPPCYVTKHQAPLAVWRKVQQGGYEPVDWHSFDCIVANDGFRIGAYGDPAMVPLPIWERAVMKARTWTGYTHQWRALSLTQDLRRWQRLLMASVDSLKDLYEAHASGWSTYRIGQADADLRSIQCPENLSTITCQRCGMCNGNRKQRHIWTEAL